MKKNIVFLLVLLMSISIFSGCSKDTSISQDSSESQGDNNQDTSESESDENFNTTGFPIVDEKITLKMMGRKAAIQGSWENLHFFTEMEKLTNISFEFDTPSTDYSEKKNLVFVSGEYPDVFFGADLTAGDEITYGEQGILIPLEDLIDNYAPNIKKLLDEDPEIRKSITAPDGHIYTLPRINSGFGLYPKLWLNHKLVTELGLEMPETIDDLYEVLKAFKDNDPNMIPLSSVRLSDIRPGLMSAFGFVGYPVTEKNGQVYYVPVEEEYKEYLTFMNRLYTEQLLDDETFSQTSEQMVAKGKEGRIGAFSQAGPFLVVGNEKNEDYYQISPLTSSVNQDKMWPKNSYIARGTAAITNNNKYPEATIRWMDYLYTAEGGRLARLGIEGEDWEWMDKEQGLYTDIRPEGVNPEEYRGGKVTPDCGTYIPTDLNKIIIIPMVKDPAEQDKIIERAKKVNPLNAFIYEQTAKIVVPYERTGYPLVYFTTEEQKRIGVLETDIATYVEQMEAKFIIGQTPLDEWDNYVATLKDMGVDELVDIYQAAYDRWNGSK